METESKKFDEEKFQKFLEAQFQSCMEQGVIKGFKTALDLVVKDIDSGLSIEKLRERIIGKAKTTQIVEEVKYNKESEQN